MLRLPKGTSDFKNIVEEEYSFIDKTLFIKEVLDDPSRVILIPRPRRFGKTTNMSMLHYFFDNSDAESNRHLFDDFNIMQAGERYTKHQGQYPVVFITLKRASKLTFEDSIEAFRIIMSECFSSHFYLQTSQSIKPHKLRQFEAILNKTSSIRELENSLLFLTQLLHAHHQKPVILLVDEYDAPMHASFSSDASYLKQMTDFMRGFLGEALKDNKALQKAVITGILQVAQASLFSGLNNINICNILSPEYSDCFGFTQEEVDDLFEKSGIPYNREEIKYWYNGYRIGDKTTVYNPWSIVSCILKKGLIGTYWLETGDYGLVGSAIEKNKSLELKQDFEALINKKHILKKIDTSIVLSDISINQSALWATLFFAGYLKADSIEGVRSGVATCSLAVPNAEVRSVFERWARIWFEESMGSADNYDNFINALLAGKIELFSSGLKRYLSTAVSYHDLGSKPKENIYHVFMLGLMAGLNYFYQIESNGESGKGRFDIMMTPRRIEKYAGVVIELKAVDNENQLQDAAKDALAQIKTKDYAAKLKACGVANILMVGLSFCGKEVEMEYSF